MIIRLILGDQLNINHSWFKTVNHNIVYCMFEMRQETDYVKHHIQKITAFFSAMRQFANELKSRGHEVVYFKINDSFNLHTLEDNLKQVVKEKNAAQIEYQFPDEYRLNEQLEKLSSTIGVPGIATDTEHFLTHRYEVKEFFNSKKQVLLESFYRYMRQKHGILVEPNGKPTGGKWNFDHENRKRWNEETKIPEPFLEKTNVNDEYNDIIQCGCSSFGNIDIENFYWPTNRKQALTLLNHFIEFKLIYFGKYQDAMSTKEPFLYHSLLSFALNIKLISPLEVVDAAIQFWQKNSLRVNIAQLEGFIRQIVGWREYMRGIYWWHMPEYANLNFFSHKQKLPQFFWSGNTKMNCLNHAIEQSLTHAYAHHIQRLMIIGNFALLIGADPDEIDAWYLGIYIDAIEWVEITNTRGMSQFADGGIVGSKPYISSANYIDKMSNYCSGCHYDKKLKYGAKSCPFNSLYWNYLDKHRSLLGSNQRMAMMYNLFDKIPAEEKVNLIKQAEQYIKNVEKL